MKKFMSFVTFIVPILVVIAIGSVAYEGFQGQKMDNESLAYVEEMLPKLLPNLSPENIKKYMDPDLVNDMQAGQIEKMAALYGQLGQFKSVGDVGGQASVEFKPPQRVITGHYTAKAVFDTGPADVSLILVKRGDTWAIFDLHINSKVLVMPVDDVPAGITPTGPTPEEKMPALPTDTASPSNPSPTQAAPTTPAPSPNPATDQE